MNTGEGRRQAALWAETSLGRLVRAACAARHRSTFDGLLVASAPIAALLLGWMAAAKLHAALVDAYPARAAIAAVIGAALVIEFAAAAFIAATQAALCLASDLGRQRCGVLLALATLAGCASTAAIASSGASQAGLPAALMIFLAAAASRWRFSHLYLADCSPRLRDFDADILKLRLLVSPQPLTPGDGHEA